MAREVESVHQFTNQQSKWSLEKEHVVIRCDDGAVYEWERSLDGPSEFKQCRRIQPDGELSTSNGRLPSAVTSTANAVIDRWSK